MLRLLFVAALVALPLWVASTAPANACSCVPDSFEPSSQVTRSDLIVVGTVTDLRLTTPIGSFATPVEGATAESVLIEQADVEWDVTVDEYIKGSGPKTITVQSNTNVLIDAEGVAIESGTNSLCGFAPEQGAHLLLFLTGSDPLTTSACAGNWEIVPENHADVQASIALLKGLVESGTDPSLPPPLGLVLRDTQTHRFRWSPRPHSRPLA